MITEFKLFERLGIEDIVVKISDKIFNEFRKRFDKNKIFQDTTDSFIVDISDNIKNEKMNIVIWYDKAQSRRFFKRFKLSIL